MSAGWTTIAAARAEGITRFRVWCEDIRCFHNEVMEWDRLGLPEDTDTWRITRLRNFVCVRCGNRKVSIRLERPPAPGTPLYNGGRYDD
jgi:hypothetical protein